MHTLWLDSKITAVHLNTAINSKVICKLIIHRKKTKCNFVPPLMTVILFSIFFFFFHHSGLSKCGWNHWCKRLQIHLLWSQTGRMINLIWRSTKLKLITNYKQFTQMMICHKTGRKTTAWFSKKFRMSNMACLLPHKNEGERPWEALD